MDFRDWLDSTRHDLQPTLIEHGFARVRRMLFGDVPNINMVGIITAHNPVGGVKATPQQNNVANEKLAAELRNGNYGPIKGIGSYNGLEDSFLVPHVQRSDVLELGKRYNQEAVIWGKKHVDSNGNPFFQFEMIDCATGEASEVRTIHVGNQDVQSRDNYFTKVKGRKFIIPFDKDDYASYVPGDKYGTIKLPFTPNQGQKQIETFFIPFFDQPMRNVEVYSEEEISYFSELLLDNPHVQELLEVISKAEKELLVEGKFGKSYWLQRGHIQRSLTRLCL